jgi:hypothetical protein
LYRDPDVHIDPVLESLALGSMFSLLLIACCMSIIMRMFALEYLLGEERILLSEVEAVRKCASLLGTDGYSILLTTLGGCTCLACQQYYNISLDTGVG